MQRENDHPSEVPCRRHSTLVIHLFIHTIIHRKCLQQAALSLQPCLLRSAWRRHRSGVPAEGIACFSIAMKSRWDFRGKKSQKRREYRRAMAELYRDEQHGPDEAKLQEQRSKVQKLQRLAQEREQKQDRRPRPAQSRVGLQDRRPRPLQTRVGLGAHLEQLSPEGPK